MSSRASLQRVRQIVEPDPDPDVREEPLQAPQLFAQRRARKESSASDQLVQPASARLTFESSLRICSRSHRGEGSLLKARCRVGDHGHLTATESL
jgi:hypothetical protein